MERGGRSDLYYKVEYSDPDNLGSFTGAVYLDGESTSHTFNDLMFYTSYCIRVSAHNGVSDQDPDRSQSRMVENCTTTPEGSKYSTMYLSKISRVTYHFICIEVFNMQFQYTLSLTSSS